MARATPADQRRDPRCVRLPGRGSANHRTEVFGHLARRPGRIIGDTEKVTEIGDEHQRKPYEERLRRAHRPTGRRAGPPTGRPRHHPRKRPRTSAPECPRWPAAGLPRWSRFVVSARGGEQVGDLAVWHRFFGVAEPEKE